MSPTMDLRHGYIVSPMVFRCVMEDILEKVSEQWAGHNCGLHSEGQRLQYACWADDTCLCAKSTVELSHVRGTTVRRGGVADGWHGGEPLQAIAVENATTSPEHRLVALAWAHGPSVKVVEWKDAWWRHTIGGMHHTDAGPGRMRLPRGHRARGKRRSGEAI